VAKKHRYFLTGSDRAEAEHALGQALEVDESDPRFVLVTKELEEQIVKLPQGIPPQRGQNWSDVEKINAALRAPVGKLEGDPDEDAKAEASGGDVAESGHPVAEGDTVKAEDEVKTAKAAKKDSEDK
jgi:hypothetical protein